MPLKFKQIFIVFNLVELN